MYNLVLCVLQLLQLRKIKKKIDHKKICRRHSALFSKAFDFIFFTMRRQVCDFYIENEGVGKMRVWVRVTDKLRVVCLSVI